MVELYIILSTVCYQATSSSMNRWNPAMDGEAIIGASFEDCITKAEITTSSRTLPGETLFVIRKRRP